MSNVRILTHIAGETFGEKQICDPDRLVALGLAAFGLAAGSMRAVQQEPPGLMTRAAAAPAQFKDVLEDLAHRRLILVCADPEVHSDLTYKRALMPKTFGDSAKEAVNTNKCHLRQATADDYGQVMRR